MVELRVVAWSLAVGILYALVLVGLGVAGGASDVAVDGGIHWLAPLLLGTIAGWGLLRPGLVAPGLALGLVVGLAALSPGELRATLEGQELFALLGGCNLFVALGGVEYAIRRVGGLRPPSLTRETGRALAAGAVAGVAYLAVVGVVISLATGRSVAALVGIPGSLDGWLIASYLYGGLWLTGAVPVALFVRFGTVLPLGVTLLDVLLFASNPTAGDAIGPVAVFAWPIYLLLFGILGGIERVSYEYVRGRGRTMVTARRVVVSAIFSVLVGVGLFEALPVWRVVPIRDPLPLRVENEDNEAHTVDVTVTNLSNGVVAFEDALKVPAHTTITREEVIEYRGRYRVEGRLGDGATDEYVVDPRDSLRSLLVWIEGELGHFRVLAVGSGP